MKIESLNNLSPQQISKHKYALKHSVRFKSAISEDKFEKQTSSQNQNNILIKGGIAISALAVGIGIVMLLCKKKPSNEIPIKQFYDNIASHLSSDAQKMFKADFENMQLIFNPLQRKDKENFIKFMSQIVEETYHPSAKLPNENILMFAKNLGDKTKDFTRILTGFGPNNFHTIKYSSKYKDIFIENFEKLADYTKHHKELKRTFFYIENDKEMIKDLTKPENKNILERFIAVIKNPKHKFTCVLSDELKGENVPKALNLNFSSNNFVEENAIKNFKGFQFYDYSTNGLIEEMNKIGSDMFMYTGNSIRFIGDEEKFVEPFYQKLAQYPERRLSKEKLTVKTGDEIITQLEQKAKSADELYEATGVNSVLHIENYEDLRKLPCKNNKPFEENYENIKNKFEHLNFITYEKGEIDTSLLNTELEKAGKLLEKNFGPATEREKKVLKQIKTKVLMGHKFAQITGEPNSFVGNILFEQSTGNERKYIDAIKKTIDGHFHELTYDPQKPCIMLRDLFDLANQSNEIFKKDGKRTFVIINNFEELVTQKGLTRERKDEINIFKQFMEANNEKEVYKTVVIASLKGDIYEYNAPAIASHRFPITLNIGETK